MPGNEPKTAALPAGPASAPARLPSHLPALDALRGIAALTVVIYHFFTTWNTLDLNAQNGPVDPLNPFPRVMAHGHDLFQPLHDAWIVVNLFLVLSGFCLFWPLVRNPNRKLGYWDFMKRRCFRILPAYYAALLIVPILAWLLKSIGLYAEALPHARGPLDVFLHLTLMHALWPSSFQSWVSVGWTLSLEWHWYFAFPLLVLLYRRLGPKTALAISLAITVGYQLLIHHFFDLTVAAAGTTQFQNAFALKNLLPARLFEFSLGLFAASLVAGGRVPAVILRHWKPIVSTMAALLVCRWVWFPSASPPMQNVFVGCVVAYIVVLFVTARPGTALHSFANNRALCWVGECSYSLYLMHLPIVIGVNIAIAKSGIHQPLALAMSLLSLPLILAMARISYFYIEMPFMRMGSSPKTKNAPIPQSLEAFPIIPPAERIASKAA